jgi:hypothetical protein
MQSTHQCSAVVICAHLTRDEIDGHASVVAAVSAAKFRVMQAARLPPQRELPRGIALSTRRDLLRDFDCQFQRRCGLRTGDARLPPGKGTFDK